MQVQESRQTSSAHWADTQILALTTEVSRGSWVSNCLWFMAQTPRGYLSMGQCLWWLIVPLISPRANFEVFTSIARCFASLPLCPHNVAACVDLLVRSSCICTKIGFFPSKLSQELGKESPHETCGHKWHHRVKTFIPLRLWLHPQAWGRWNPAQLELNT